MCPRSTKGREEAEADIVELISWTKVKHKARNRGDNRSSVTDNGGGEHWSRDKVETHMLGLREWKRG